MIIRSSFGYVLQLIKRDVSDTEVVADELDGSIHHPLFGRVMTLAGKKSTFVGRVK